MESGKQTSKKKNTKSASTTLALDTTTQTIEGDVTGIRASRDAWHVFTLRAGRAETICVGVIPSLEIGATLRLYGETVPSPYGEQFKFSRFEVLVPQDVNGISKLIVSKFSGLGIGEVAARKIAEALGSRTLELLSDETALAPIIGAQRAQLVAARALEVFASQRAQELMTLFASHAITPYQIQLMLTEWGDKAKWIFEKNPYKLVEINGIAFKTADAIAMKMGVSSDDPRRAEAALRYILSDAAECEGHTWLTADSIGARAGKLGVPPCDWVALARSIPALYVDETGTRISHRYYYDVEVYIAQRLIELCSSDDPLDASAVACADLTELQRTALTTAAQSRVMVLTGNPGTGKTYTIRRILELCVHSLEALGCRDDYIRQDAIALCAPTGKAAKRMEELTLWSAKTMHSVLGYGKNNPEPKYNDINQMPHKIYIVDEASMIDIVLFYNFVRALSDDSRVILVGDIDQLPPVGAGSPLRDIIDSGVVPVVRLTEIMRQAQDSRIIANAHRIVRGELPQFGDANSDFYLWQVDDCDELISKLVNFCANTLKKYFDPVEDVQILAPMNTRKLSVSKLNEALRLALNPLASSSKAPLSVGDKVMQTVNNYNLGVFNGDWGIITHLETSQLKPERITSLDVAFKSGDKTRTVTYKTYAEIQELKLSYAITIHKSQGSEFRCVIVVIHTTDTYMLERNLLYTAITRAKSNVIVIGQADAVAHAVRTTKQTRRKTYLCEMLYACRKSPATKNLANS